MIDTAIITAAGYGTRFLPATKNVPKEMLPLIDVPILHEVVKECIDAGIVNIVIVTRHGNNAVEDYFDNNKELEDYLASQGKLDRYARFNEVFDQADIAYVRQHKNMPYGNGTPLLAAKPFLTEGKPFAVLFGDDLVLAKESGIGQLIKKFETLESQGKKPGGVLASQFVSKEEVKRYGVFKFKEGSTEIMQEIVEKPTPEMAPSLLASYGRYVLSYDLFNHLSVDKTGKDGELWAVDAITALSREKEIYTHNVEGRWYTTGDPVNMLRATLAYALAREDLRSDTLKMLQESLSELTK